MVLDGNWKEQRSSFESLRESDTRHPSAAEDFIVEGASEQDVSGNKFVFSNPM